MARPLPEAIQTALEPICDDLRRMVDGDIFGQHLGVHAVTAPKLVEQMLDAGCRGQAGHMALAAAHMRKAVVLFPVTGRKLTSTEWQDFTCHVEHAFNSACWALLLEAFETSAEAA